jgi:hypothetical protein
MILLRIKEKKQKQVLAGASKYTPSTLNTRLCKNFSMMHDFILIPGTVTPEALQPFPLKGISPSRFTA